MLKDTFFTIQSSDDTENNLTCRIALNVKHPIFQAHFAGDPIMPGACIVQMIKELTSDHFGRAFFVGAVKNMKFLQAINPLESPEISVRLSFTQPEKERVTVSAILQDGDRIFTKATLLLDYSTDRQAVNVAAFNDLETANVRRSVHTAPPKFGLQRRMEALRLCVVVPTFNNPKTLPGVLNDLLRYTSSIIVVNDGSNDTTDEILKNYAGRIEIISYRPNRGKGYALKSGFDRAEALGYKGAITIDSDGQHRVSDIERFVTSAENHPGTLLLGQRTAEGEMPAGNSFANRFSNFWFAVQTAYRFRDTQNGFRLYPLSAMNGLRPLSSRYEAELEMLVRAAWKGIRIMPVPVRVYYPSEGERISHFRPTKDFLRISLLNTLLTLLAVVYGYPSMFIHWIAGKMKKS